MAKTYQIWVNDGKGTEVKPVNVVQGAGAKGEAVRLIAKRGWRFQLYDELKGKELGPDQVRVKRVGKDLAVFFDGSQRADAVLEGFYADNTDKSKDNGMPMLVGQAENGSLYEYVPQDPAVSSMTAQLNDGNTPVIASLGGGPLEGDFALAGLPLVVAAGGGGWLVGGAALVGAAALSGGKGGGGAPAPASIPSGQTGALKHDAVNDTGQSSSDGLTNNANPTYTGVAEKGAAVEVTVNGVTYKTTASAVDGSYSVPLLNGGQALPDGTYTPKIKVTNAAGGTSTVDGTPFTVDHSATTNQPNNQADPNKDAAIDITAVSDDTGTNAHDFITTDTTVVVSGRVTGFTNTGAAAGERLRVQILDATNKVVADEYVVPASDGTWTMSAPTSALAKGTYTIKSSIEDAAGNEVKSATHALTITDAQTMANADTNTVTEDTALTASGALIAGDANGAGADSATQVPMSALKVAQIKADAGTYATVATTGQTTINGTYGSLKVAADGSYTYELRNSDANVQALHNTPAVDKFYYMLTDGQGHTSETTLTITVNGQNDAAVFKDASGRLLTGPITGQIRQTGSASITDVLKVADADAGESVLNVGVGTTQYTGQFGVFSIQAGATPGDYNWAYDKSNVDLGVSDAIRHDLFVVKSIDGSASQTFDINVTSPAGLTKQEFHALTVDGLQVVGSSTLADELMLHGTGVFDFTSAQTSLSSVETIQADYRHAGANTVKLNLANLIQADGHVLTILGDANDAVVMTGATYVFKTVNAGFTDYKYLSANNDELHLLVQNVMNQTGI